MLGTSRFDCASSSVALKTLLRKTERVFWICFGLGVAAHLSLSQIRALQAEQKIAKPLTTQFVKRQPRLTKPLELKKRPQPKRRQIQRELVSVRARAAAQETGSHIPTAELVRGLARPGAHVSRGASFLSGVREPQALARAIQGTKEVHSAVDLSLEMLDVEALNTGQYDALVIQDPSDKRSLKGFCHLSVLYIPRVHDQRVPGSDMQAWFDWYVLGGVRNLADAMNRYTMIETDVLGKVTFGDERLLKTPWIYTFASSVGYELSGVELEILGQYLMEGGFVFADSFPREYNQTAGLLSHAAALLGAVQSQGIEARFEELPKHHPIYHCYFDFNGPPHARLHSSIPNFEGKFEGLEVGGRLLAILSSKGYYSPWVAWGRTEGVSEWYRKSDPTRHFQMGVNLIVFAVTQEGSITNRVMDSVR